MKPIDIKAQDFRAVKAILLRHVPEREVWAFGSRVTWSAKNSSDLDLVVMGEKPLPLSVISALAEDFTESNLHFKVDVVDWATTKEAFRKIIDKEYVVVQSASDQKNKGEFLETIYGRFAGDFIEDRLSALCVSDGGIQTGLFGSQLHQEDYVEVGTPIITVEHLGENRIIHDSIPFVSDEDKRRLSKYTLQKTDIVFSRVGSVDRRALVREEEEGWLFSGRCLRVRPNPHKIDSEYLSYFFGLPSFKEHIRAIAVGVTMPSLNTQILSDVSIPYPRDISTQRRIAHILGTLDDKIELNRRMNETLEAMARELFKSWFVDFDPVRAKAEGRDPGMPQPLADLFPDSFEDSELGEIPKGWRLGSVDDEFDLTMGQSPPGETYNEAGVGLPFYQGCTDFGFRFPTRRIYCTAPTRLAKAGDTLVSVWAPVGDINMASEDCAIGRGVAAMRHKTGSRSYSYQFMQSIEEVFSRFEAEGTVFGSIGKKDFHSIACVNPPRELVLAYEARVSPLDDRVEVNERESRTLAVLRDTLLPKLISGELRVKNAERIMEIV